MGNDFHVDFLQKNLQFKSVVTEGLKCDPVKPYKHTSKIHHYLYGGWSLADSLM